MPKLKVAIVGTLCLLGAAPVRAAVTFYDNQAAFLNAVRSGYYAESFDSAAQGAQGPLDFAGPGSLPDFRVVGDDPNPDYQSTYPFTIPGGSATDVWMGLESSEIPLLFTITGGTAPTAIGGTFADGDINGNLVNGLLTLDVVGQGTHTFPVTTAGQFVGAVSDTPITSFRLSAADQPGVDDFPVANNLILGTAVPEPAAPLLCAAVAAMGALVRRRAR